MKRENDSFVEGLKSLKQYENFIVNLTNLERNLTEFSE